TDARSRRQQPGRPARRGRQAAHPPLRDRHPDAGRRLRGESRRPDARALCRGGQPMSRTLAVFKREYLQAVRTKTFVVMTLLLPLLMAALVTVPALLAGRGLAAKRIAVVDGTGALRAQIAKPHGVVGATLVYIDGHGQADLKAFAKPSLDTMRLGHSRDANHIDAVVLVPASAQQDPKVTLKYYSRSSTDLIGQTAVSLQVNGALQRQRLLRRGLTPGDAAVALHHAEVD